MHFSICLSLPLTLAILSPLALAHQTTQHLELCPSFELAPPNPHDSHKPPNKLHITGDRLNVTRCYCELPTLDSWGYILQADYWNYHTSRKYRSIYQCLNETRSQPDVPACWDMESRVQEDGWLKCDEHDEGNKFCYQMGFKKPHGMFGSSGLRASDTFYFNNQARAVDSLTPSATPAPEICDALCYVWLGQLVPARDNATTWSKTLSLPKGQRATICSRSEVYTDLDDMCWNCKKEE